MVQFVTVVSSLSLVALIFFYGGLPGLVITIGVTLIFEAMHKSVYGKSISHIEDEDHHDHPDNPRNVLNRMAQRGCRESSCPARFSPPLRRRPQEPRR